MLRIHTLNFKIPSSWNGRYTNRYSTADMRLPIDG